MTTRVPDNPFQHFCELFAALNEQRGWFESATYLRFAAMAALCSEGEPNRIASEIRELADDLKKRSGWFGDMRSDLRFVIAAVLRLRGDRAAAFHDEVERVRTMFREAGVRRDSTYELLAILVMRCGLDLAPIDKELVRRLKEMYEEMKRYQWWLTGTDDLPACGMLALRDEPIGLMAQRIEQIYQGLHLQGFAKCNELQSCSNLLYLAEGRAELAAERAGTLFREFWERKVRIRRADYDELTILSFLLDDSKEIIDRVLAHRDRLRELKPRPDKQLAFSIAATITFLELMQSDSELMSISHVKLIVDVQAVIAAQRAAAATAAAAAGS